MSCSTDSQGASLNSVAAVKFFNGRALSFFKLLISNSRAVAFRLTPSSCTQDEFQVTLSGL